MITIETKGAFKNTDAFLNKISGKSIYSKLENYAYEGVLALQSATPIDSGNTAKAWDFTVEIKKGVATITWTNDHMVDGLPVAILLQYGHATGTGGYVQGYDYINPALKTVFNKIADNVWKAVTEA